MASNMKVIVLLWVILAVVGASGLESETTLPKAQPMTLDDYLDLLEGCLEGLDQDYKLYYIRKSITDTRKTVKATLALIEMFKKIDWKVLDTVFDVFTKLFDTLEIVFDTLQLVFPAYNEIVAFLAKIKTINWDHVLVQMLLNAPKLYTWIREAIYYFDMPWYDMCGTYIGRIIYQILFTPVIARDPKDHANSLLDFMKGFLEGLNEKGDFNELLKCLKDVDPIIAKIMQAIELILKMQLQDVVKGVMLLFEAVTQLIKLVTPCAKGFSQLEKLLKAILHADIISIARKILSNPQPYIKDLTDCVNAFKQGNFLQAGKDIGDVLYRLFLDVLKP
jgi:hypothetical protein